MPTLCSGPQNSKLSHGPELRAVCILCTHHIDAELQRNGLIAPRTSEHAGGCWVVGQRCGDLFTPLLETSIFRLQIPDMFRTWQSTSHAQNRPEKDANNPTRHNNIILAEVRHAVQLACDATVVINLNGFCNHAVIHGLAKTFTGDGSLQCFRVCQSRTCLPSRSVGFQ